jgi:hypothetical protein
VRKAGRWVDIAVIAAVTAVAALLSQSWPGFNSPDSEFYASLALYGSDVVDRAIEPAYIWTRLGYIAPVRGLVLSFGPWVGFEIWRVLLLVVITAAVYSMVHIAGRPRALGAALALFTALNSVVLSYVGNTYLSGTVLAGYFALVALGVWSFGSVSSQGRGLLGSPRWTTGLFVGLLLAWLIMTNPYGAILAGGTWFAMRMTAHARLKADRWPRLLTDFVAAGLGFAATFSVFLWLGREIFPGRNWIATYLEWNSRLDYTVFIGDATTWQRDSALLVLVCALVTSGLAVWLLPARRWAWAALASSGATIFFTALMMTFFTGPWLESPTYVALLFPGALSALALVFIAVTPGTFETLRVPSWVWVTSVPVGALLLILIGLYEGVLGVLIGWTIAVCMTVSLGVLIWLTRREYSPRRLWASVLLASLVITYVGAQLLQNGRGLLGIYGQYPFAAAYQDYKGREQMEAKITVQEWLLDRTDASDAIAIWSDPAGLGASTAAMQMWGGDNLATLDATLDRDASDRLSQIAPTVVAMYSPDPGLIDDFYASLPPWSLPSDLECTTVGYPVVSTGSMTACIARLTWVD